MKYSVLFLRTPALARGASLPRSCPPKVEGVSAELRHYLKRLARRSRCFSRCPYALKCAVRLLVFCYNQRQHWKWFYPAYPANSIDFLHLQV